MAKIPAVTEYTVSETLLGGHVVNYQCPHCDAQLKSKESEIGQATQCPKCGNGYGVSRRAAKEIQQAKAAKEEDKRRRDEEREAAKPKCVICGSKGSLLSPVTHFRGGHYCWTHRSEVEDRFRQKSARAEQEARNHFEQLVDAVIVTTAPNVEEYRITKYLGVDGVEFVTGTGMFSETVSDVSDFFGARSKMFESKLRQGRLAAIRMFKHLAVKQGANAIVGMDFDYSEFANNRTAIIVNGTLVRVEPRMNSLVANNGQVVEDV